MKNIISIALIPIVLFSCNNTENKEEESKTVAADSGWATDHLIGEVKTVEETNYTPDENGKIGEMDSCCIESVEYNERGYAIKTFDKDKEGNMTSEATIERRDDGKFISYKRMEKGNQVFFRKTYFKADGKIDRVEDTDSTMKVVRIHSKIKENDIGQALEGESHTPDKKYLGTWAFTYTDGMRTGNTWMDSTRTEVYNSVGELNDKGLLSKRTEVKVGDDGKKEKSVETYTYDSFDETGNWTQRTKYDEEGKATQVVKRAYSYF